MADVTDDLSDLKGDEKIVAEAKKRWRQCDEWEGEFRVLFIDDLKFANGDSYNNWQWPDNIYAFRTGANEMSPCLTINKVRQHNLQIINDAKQNKPGVNIRPNGNGSSFKAAQVFEGIVRQIEYHSGAEHAYDTATEFQVQAGIGYIRVVTEYVGPDTFDQDIFIRGVKDPLTIYLDPDIDQVDGSDARFGFVFTDVPRDKAEDEYSDHRDDFTKEAIGNSDGWITEGHVRFAEYYRKVQKRDELAAIIDADGAQQFIRKSMMTPELWKAALEASIRKPQTREVTVDKVEWYKIAGNTIIDRRDWLGIYIPIVRVVGEEKIIEGKLHRAGHTRAMLDPQRMYNFMSSSAVEFAALQPRTPFRAPLGSIEGLETYYKNANTTNSAVLPYNPFDDQGRALPAPDRMPPPGASPAFMAGMQVAQNEMMMSSGQYEVEFGQQGNERSGKAIDARQRQGDNATYHFIDGLGIAIQFLGKILIDLIPKIYDTPRIVLMMDKKGTQQEVSVDPRAKGAYSEEKDEDGEDDDAIRAIFNPNVGRYSVQADIGPAYATKRQEAWNAFVQITAQNKELVGIIGDLMFQNADFPGADEIAERLKRLVPDHVKGDGPSPDMVQAGQKMEGMQKVIAQLVEALGEERKKLSDQSRDIGVKEYSAETDRLKVASDWLAAHPEIVNAIAFQLAQSISATPMPGGDEVAMGAEPIMAPSAVDPSMMPAGGPGAAAMQDMGAMA